MQQVSQTGVPIAIELHLKDCLSSESQEHNKLGKYLSFSYSV